MSVTNYVIYFLIYPDFTYVQPIFSDSIFNFADVPEETPSRCENVDTFPSFASASPTLLIKNWTLEETVMLNVDISAAK